MALKITSNDWTWPFLLSFEHGKRESSGYDPYDRDIRIRIKGQDINF
jgi:hypothetical protein